MRFFNLYSDIFITKGYNRILISDLGRNISKLYPLELHELIAELKSTSIESVLENYDSESKIIVQEYVDYLLEKEYGFITEGDWDKNFPPLSYAYHDYQLISNLFIEVEKLALSETLIHSIVNLNIKHLVVFCRSAASSQDLIDFDGTFENTPLEGLEIYSAYSTAINADFLQAVQDQSQRIYHLVFYQCEEVPVIANTSYKFMLDFTEDILSINSCGKVNVDDFSTNMPKVLEAINHNSCLHKKLGIDINGNIKNCPAMPQSFGNINEMTLEQVLQQDAVQQYWHLTKDEVMVCKDCEFRNVCTDCRAFTERSHDNKLGLDISKPLKCGYDPYSNEWSDWSLNPLKQQAIAHYGFEQLTVKE
ncbi:grasp-with-spasm system SPASM domain peptide maturase [Sphingobacterium sp. SRCM116780]|uniref:grasp-with-spasm system SPASM domain peptide maturase n=1 Tax=Sphingobacterium sp. SRCM116780 TaxID=2907623 RepID=UPI001F304A43|nr:grasp-with-spasm system SPASM domain peptide maturase [Sphingobacterium sp. SRCM116780]UIR55011.1 grasp-with-spasm system SPASM domain peptide maturase [Sphingobacterium sp. SRCM116780]